MERMNFEMTEAQLATLIEACKPIPYLLTSGGSPPPSRQECANAAWAALGEEMGFEYMTVEPDFGGERFFTAVPTAKKTANLCNHCSNNVATCNASPKFGTGTGNDNVYECDGYGAKEGQ